MCDLHHFQHYGYDDSCQVCVITTFIVLCDETITYVTVHICIRFTMQYACMRICANINVDCHRSHDKQYSDSDSSSCNTIPLVDN